jgi:hypothetical protein
LTGILRPAPRIACSAASSAACGRRRERPLGRIELLDVVHEVQPDGVRGARIERCEDAGLALGLDHRGLLETGVARQLGHAFGAVREAAVLRGNRWRGDPVAQARDCFGVPFWTSRPMSARSSSPAAAGAAVNVAMARAAISSALRLREGRRMGALRGLKREAGRQFIRRLQRQRFDRRHRLGAVVHRLE